MAILQMMAQKQIIESILNLCVQNFDIEVVWLYGSRVNERGGTSSDFDIAIAFKNFNLPIVERFLRPNELAIEWAAKLGLAENKVSIVDINLVPVYLSFNIVEYGKIIYQTDTLRAYREQDRIYSQYEFQMIESERFSKCASQDK